jgi:Restriction endonuclease XhoI
MQDLDRRVAAAVARFWKTRSRQRKHQGTQTGTRDHGNRTAATGGKQLDGFGELVAELLAERGLPNSVIFRDGRGDVTLPGFFRPTKQWDLVVVAGGSLLAAVEFKSLCGPSFGNNYNNRIEEAIGNSTDLWTAYREGAFQTSPRPFLGYLMLLEDADGSTRPVAVREKHFKVFEDYRDASYANRCEQSVRRLMRERCYDAACLLLSNRPSGARGGYVEPARDLAFEHFAKILCNHIVGTYTTL